MSIVTTMAKAIRFQLAPAALTSMWTEKENIAEDMKAERFARAALRAIKPSDISDGMVEAYLRAHGGSDESVKKALFMGVNDFRRAIAAAIAAGAEQ